MAAITILIDVNKFMVICDRFKDLITALLAIGAVPRGGGTGVRGQLPPLRFHKRENYKIWGI